MRRLTEDEERALREEKERRSAERLAKLIERTDSIYGPMIHQCFYGPREDCEEAKRRLDRSTAVTQDCGGIEGKTKANCVWRVYQEEALWVAKVAAANSSRLFVGTSG